MGLSRPIIMAALFSSLAWGQYPGIVFSETLPVFATGNTASGYVNGVTSDSAGNIYITGQTWSSSLPVTPGAPQTALTGAICTDPTYNPLLPPTMHPCSEPFLVELDPKGNVVFGTYLNGVTGIAVDGAGNIYYSGTLSLAPPEPTGNSATVISKFNPKTNATLYSFPIVGVSGGLLMTTDAQGNLYFAATAASNFSATPGALNGNGHIALGKVNAAGNALVYAAKLGGTYVIGDSVASITVDGAGSLFLTGGTSSADFPVTAGAFQTQPPNHEVWAYVTKLNPAGSSLLYSSFLGGSTFDDSSQIQVDSAGEAYVLGLTQSTDFPVTPGAYQTTYTDIGSTGFLAKFKADGAGLIFATYIDGAFGFDAGTNPIFATGASSIDTAGNIYVAGESFGGLSVTAGATQSCMGGGFRDAFVAEFTPQGALTAATYLGGSSLDSAQALVVNSDGTVTVIGNSWSSDFPITTGPEPNINYFITRMQIADPNRADTPCLTLAAENSASLSQKEVAPGELVTLLGNHFGPDTGVTATPDANGNLPTELAGVRVIMDGVAVPLLYVQSQQINAQAPFELAGKQTVTFHVEYQGVASATATSVVHDQSPDLFRLAPGNQGLIFNQDGSLNSPSNPAAVGSVAWTLGTGGGVLSPALATGSIAPLSPLSYLALPPTVLIDDGIPATVQYAGSSPTLPAGVFQINFVVPQPATNSNTHTVDISFGPIGTNTPVTIAIK